MNLPLLTLFLATALATNVAKVQDQYDRTLAARLLPMLSEAIRFPTYENNAEAHAAQKAWLVKTGSDLGFTVRDAGKITEIELPASSPNAPVLGLVVHGDVQPVNADDWSLPPFSGKYDEQYVYGRGSADDKGPLVQALLAMKALADSGVPRTHTVRLLVGSTEESDSKEMGEYLKDQKAPDYSLVLDSTFPVVVGEKAWNSLSVSTKLTERGTNPFQYTVDSMWAGLSASIVPDHAEVTLRWRGTGVNWQPIEDELHTFKMPEGTRVATLPEGATYRIVVYGHSTHAGMNLEAGRNALVALGILLNGKLPPGGANDLLTFARTAGQDLYGTGLGIRDRDPVWGRYAVNVATIKEDETEKGTFTLTINIRSIPPRTGPQRKAYFEKFVADFNRKTGAALTTGGYWDDEPLGFSPNAKMVKRLLDDYAAATGKREKPSISGGGTYAKRLPNAIAFGMWFPDKPYPGHDLDEKNPIADLVKGEKVLIYALTDIATGPPMKDALR